MAKVNMMSSIYEFMKMLNFSVRYFKYNFMNNIHLKLLRFPAVLLAQGNLKKINITCLI